ncbi:fluoride efflux transporter CrcB [Lentibacillus cibarius]|uniref:Fluoride-specific ion channel FluC n=1 Tax=Lentibacillus cibarius TaxID=2583219 RepID=A0A549YGE3_9BACI|nr:fluoride efflux transporter CrcB [Lentibacillus cibarius]TRM10966.1 fluoride efflux transporter CrcB [Lentibacillus cibarius]
MQLFFVMAGGFLGAVVRFALGEWIGSADFPLATMLANLSGCLFLGWFMTFSSWQEGRWREVSLFIGTGFTGSFTTFSTFSLDMIQLIRDGDIWQGAFYSSMSIVGGLLLAYIGYKLANVQFKRGEP